MISLLLESLARRVRWMRAGDVGDVRCTEVQRVCDNGRSGLADCNVIQYQRKQIHCKFEIGSDEMGLHCWLLLGLFVCVWNWVDWHKAVVTCVLASEYASIQ
jgi:hypothetical protein